MYIIIIVYYINSNHNASHIGLEHNELRHRKIKKNHSTHFFLQSKKNPSSGGKSQNTYAAKLLDHLLKKAVQTPGM